MADALVKAWAELKVVLHWNRVMVATWSIMALLTPLALIPDNKVCTEKGQWQGFLWIGLAVVGLVGAVGEYIDDETTDFGFCNVCAECCCVDKEKSGKTGSDDEIRCFWTEKDDSAAGATRHIGYFMRFLSNLSIVGLTLVVVGMLYLKDPTCKVFYGPSAPTEFPNANPAFNPSTPQGMDVPYVPPPSEAFRIQQHWSRALLVMIITTVVLVAVRVLCWSYPPKKEVTKPTRLILHTGADEEAPLPDPKRADPGPNGAPPRRKDGRRGGEKMNRHRHQKKEKKKKRRTEQQEPGRQEEVQTFSHLFDL